LDYIIHRGRDEIGGICIEVAADDGTRILLDLGMPLYDARGTDYPFDTPQRPTAELLKSGVLCDIPALYADDPAAPGFAAIIVTHSHLDHYGLAHHAHPAIPVYGSRGTLAIFEVGKVFFPDAAQPADVRVLPDDGPLRVGPLTVTGIPVDHSAPDARALLVEGDDQKLIYSGDLRAHGRTGFRFGRLLADPRLRDADWLLIEGTTLGAGGDSHGLPSEQEVEEALVGLATGEPDKAVVVLASGQNLDRLVSCYRAARRLGRLLVVDPYQAYVLMKLAPLSKNIPQFTWEGVRVSFAPHQVGRLKAAGMMGLAREMGRAARVSSAALAADPARYLLCLRGSFGTTKLLTHIGAGNVELVWSMWGGYWTRENCAARKWAEREGVRAHFIHSGGHAWPEDLRRLEAALRPRSVEIVHAAKADVGQSDGVMVCAE
jgi:ribonuclease J